MRGKEIKAVAKKTLGGIFKEGDEVIVQSVLREKDTVVVNALGGLFDAKDKFLQIIPCYKQIHDKPIGEKVPYKEGSDLYMTKMYEAVVAKKGDYLNNVIIVNGREYCGEILGGRTLAEYFDKI